ncbi:MAG: flagellar biosynthesis protein FlhB [Alphaproteobacteria bacterium]|nr:flagellar biosynthesis protein FlhB [Alphaproteobacteria bacterium]
MADDQDQDSKTEEPTGKRVSEAEDKGQVAQSQEISTWIMLGTFALTLVTFGGFAASGLARHMASYLDGAVRIEGRIGDIVTGLGELFGWSALFVLPIFVALAVAAVLSHVLQHPITLSTEKLAPDIARLSPMAGFKRLFSLHTLTEFVKNLIKLVVVGVVMFVVLRPEVIKLSTAVGIEPIQVLELIRKLVMKALIAVLAILFIIALADFVYQKWEYMRSLRMTKQEIKDEHKETEGSPEIKGRLRSLRMQRARARMMAAVPKADVVVTNPTHFAVALAYEPDAMAAPKCIAKGADLLAVRIRQIAQENDVPVIENPPLARALHAGVEVDEEIRPEHYQAVAEIITFVFQLKGKALPQRPTG